VTLKVTVKEGGGVKITSPERRKWGQPSSESCENECTAAFEKGSKITLQAVPAEGYAFSGWSGDCPATKDRDCTFEMKTAKTAVASFSPVQSPPPPFPPVSEKQSDVKQLKGMVTAGAVIIAWAGLMLGFGLGWWIAKGKYFRLGLRAGAQVDKNSLHRLFAHVEHLRKEVGEHGHEGSTKNDSDLLDGDLLSSFKKLGGEISKGFEDLRSSLIEMRQELEALRRFIRSGAFHPQIRQENDAVPSTTPATSEKPDPKGQKTKHRTVKQVLGTINASLLQMDYDKVHSFSLERGGAKVSNKRPGGRYLLVANSEGALYVVPTNLAWVVLPPLTGVIGDSPLIYPIYQTQSSDKMVKGDRWWISEPALAFQVSEHMWEVTSFGTIRWLSAERPLV
jgi:hypothetical protein